MINPKLNNRILVVDDNVAIHGDFAKVLCPKRNADALLEDEALLFSRPVKAQNLPGFELDFAASGMEALMKVQTALHSGKPYAVVFMDMHMPPGWDGVETVEQLWKVDAALQVVFCTAYSGYSCWEMHARLGREDQFLILKKPFEEIEVVQMAVALRQKWTATKEMNGKVKELDRRVAERTRHLQLQVEATLASEKRFSSAFELTPVPMLILHAASFSVVNANDCFRKLSRHPALTTPRSAATALLERNADLLARLTAGGPMAGVECQVEVPGMGQRTLTVSREWFHLAGELHLLVSAEDITARLSVEEHLRQSQKMEAVGQLAAGIAHDFNNIMTVVVGRISDHVADLTLPLHCRDSLTEVLNSTARAAELTQQLLAFGRRQSLVPQSLDLEDHLQAQVRLLGRVIGETCRIILQFPAGLPPVQADPSAIHHIVMNLVINARDAMPRGGRIRIGAARYVREAGIEDGHQAAPGRYLCLSVRDEGCGMEESVKSRIFEPFFTTKEVGKGSGLGLPMVVGLVSQLSGWMEVDSVPAQGTEIRIYLPEAAHAPASPALHPGIHSCRMPAGKGHRALIVEDDAPIRQMLSGMVRRFGFDVCTASSANEALDLWSREHLADSVDLVITDIVMPGSISGLSLGDRLREQRPDLAVIYSTGYSEEMLKAEAPARPRTFLPKPYEMMRLASLLVEFFPPEDSPVN